LCADEEGGTVKVTFFLATDNTYLTALKCSDGPVRGEEVNLDFSYRIGGDLVSTFFVDHREWSEEPGDKLGLRVYLLPKKQPA
jgi:hypothetical protein